jgi:hypothetical protein
MLLDTYKNFTVSPVVRRVGVVRDQRMGCSVPLWTVWLGDVMTLITAVDEITSRIQISGMDQVEEVSGVGHTVGRWVSHWKTTHTRRYW